jgi:hypothetical protein
MMLLTTATAWATDIEVWTAENFGTFTEGSDERTSGYYTLTNGKGTDYDYSYTNNTSVGTAKVTVTFKGTYASLGSVEKEFTIVYPTVTTSYVEADGTLHENVIAIPLDNTMTTLTEGWYVVNDDVDYTGMITLDGDVNIILGDGKTMTVSSDSYGIDGSTDGTLTIYGQTLGTGILTATGTNIGIVTEGIVTINGGTVTAIGTNDVGLTDVGIRSIDGITINGGTVTTTGLMADGNVTISGGKVTATDDPGICSNSGTVTIGWTSADDYIQADSYVIGAESGTVTIANGQSFYNGSEMLSGTITDMNKLNGTTLRPFKTITLANNADNSSTISEWNGGVADVTLAGRTFYKDGAWNTLVLPFDVSNAQLDETVHPLHGSTIMELDGTTVYNGHKTGFDADNGMLYLNFNTVYNYFFTSPGLVAGRPYIVKWETGDDITDPVFRGVTVKSGLNDFVSEDGMVRFKGSYAPINWTEENKSVLFMSAENTLNWPKPDLSDPENPKYPRLSACRAYFQLADGAEAREFNIHFGEDDTTGIFSTTDFTDYTDKAGAWYSLDGRKLDKKPTRKGLYLYGGCKVVVK